ncbi:MAG: GNAT family N-acetyltransferase [Chloroflexota bacterium]
MLDIKLANPDTDYERLAHLYNVADNENITSDNLRTWDVANKDAVLLRYSAFVEDTLIGYGVIHKAKSAVIDRYFLWLTIDSAYRKQGYGTQLYTFLYDTVMSYAPTELSSSCKDTDEADLRFAEKHGFSVRRHLFDTELDLTTFDADKWQAYIDNAKEQGIRFTTLADEGNTETAQRKLFELNKTTAEDNPSSDGTFDMSFDTFQTSIFNADWFRVDGQHLAVDDERYVGLGAIGFSDDGQHAYNAYTGVDADYRGRGIALALKVIGACYAKANGATVLITDNDSENKAMLHINFKLGYVRRPGTYLLINRL